MNKIDTDDLRRIAADATLGPWQTWHSAIMASGGIDTYSGSVLGSIAHVNDTEQQDEEGRYWGTSGTKEANARLIALAPQLAAEVIAARAREAELQARLDEARAAWEAFEGATITDDHFAAVDRIRAALGIGDHPHD